MSDIKLQENSIVSGKPSVEISLISSVQVDTEVLVKLALVNILYDAVAQYIAEISNLYVDKNIWPPTVRLISTNAGFDTLCVQLFGDQYLSNNPGIHFAYGYMKHVLNNQIVEFKEYYTNDSIRGEHVVNASDSFLSRLDEIFEKRFGQLSKGTRCDLNHESVCDHCRACLSFLTEAFRVGHGLAAEFFEAETTSNIKQSIFQKFGLGTGKSLNPLLHLADKLSITQDDTTKAADSYIILNVNRYDFTHHRILPLLIYHHLVCSPFIRPNQPLLEFNQVFVYWLAKEFMRFCVGADHNFHDPERISSVRDIFNFYNNYVEAFLDNLATRSALVTKFREIASKFLAFMRHEYLPFREADFDENAIDQAAWQVIRRFCVDLILSNLPNDRICRALIYFDSYYLTNSAHDIVECFVIEPILRDLDGNGIRQGLVNYFAHQPNKQIGVKLDMNARRVLRALLIDAFNDAWGESENLDGHNLILQLENIGKSYGSIIIFLLQKGMNIGQSLEEIATALLEADDEESLLEQENNDMENPVMITFLIEIGRWAMSELKERWTLRRKEQELKLNDMTESQLEAATPEILSSLIADKGQAHVERTLERIQSKHYLIQGWKDALVADQQQQQLGAMNLDVLNARKRDFNAKIVTTLREIEADVHALGFTVDKA